MASNITWSNTSENPLLSLRQTKCILYLSQKKQGLTLGDSKKEQQTIKVGSRAISEC